MASDNYVPLITISNAKGLDSTSAGDYLAPGDASALSNVNTWRNQGALSTQKGRSNIFTISGYNGYYINGLFATDVASGYQGYLVSLTTGVGVGSSGAVVAYDPNGAGQVAVTNGLPFTRAIQYNDTVYTNANQRINTSFFPTVIAYTWQQPAPTGPFTASAVSGTLPAGTYYYAFTHVVTTLGGTGNTGPQETTPTGATPLQGPPPPASLYPYTVTSTGTSGAQLTCSSGWAGTYSDGSSFTTNVYRLSTITDEWYLLVNLTSGTTYTDNANDTSIQANQILNQNQDPPPFNDEFTTITGGFPFEHQGRVFAFSSVDYSGNNNTTQMQLWWSELGVPWSFNQVSSVLLVGNQGSVETYAYYGYGEWPAGGLSMGGTALVYTNRNCYILFGNDPADYYLTQAFNVGLIAPQSLTYGLGQAFWLAPEGPYTFLGTGPQYIGMKVRETIDAVPYSDRINAVGFMLGLTWYLSFPASNFTLMYYTPTGDWSYLPYAVTAASFQSSNPRIYQGATTAPYNNNSRQGEVIGARAVALGTAPAVDRWATGETDLGAPVTASWTSPLTQSGKPQMRKTYSYIILSAPFQPGTAQVTLTIDPNNPARTGAAGTANAPQVFTTPVIDLSGASYAQPETRHIYRVSPDLRGYQAQVTVTYTNTTGQTSGMAIYDVAVLGTYDENLVLPS